MMNQVSKFIPSLLFALLVPIGNANAQHFDIFLARPAAGSQTVIGGADVDGLAYNDTTRVFDVELGDVGGEFLALEPGVNHANSSGPALTAYPASATPLQPGDVLRLKERDFTVAGVSDDLFYWNGMGSVSFAPAAADFRIDEGDPLGSVAGAGGAFDDHPFMVIDSTALPGIYLASAFGTVNDFAPSQPVYLVMGTEGLITADFLGISQAAFDMLTEDDLDAALEEVIELGAAYAQANLVPEPSTSILAGLAACAAGFVLSPRRRVVLA